VFGMLPIDVDPKVIVNVELCHSCLQLLLCHIELATAV
jgi:hypothetical protein